MMPVDSRSTHPRALAWAATLWLVSAVTAQAATFTVSTLADNLTVDAVCTLREAIAAHNAAVGTNDCGTFDAAADTINFSVTGTILLNSGLGELTISAPALVIDGPGTALLAVDGQNAMSILVLNPTQAVVLTVQELTLQHGSSSDQGLNASGGGAIRHTVDLDLGAAIDDSITVRDVLFLENTARTVAGIGVGGAIRAYGPLVVLRSRFLRNSADLFGAVYHFNGALQVEDSSFEESVGGTLSVISSGAAVRSSLFRANRGQSTPTSGVRAAAVSVGSGPLLIENSTFQNNEVFSLGHVVGTNVANPIPLTVRNCTFADTTEFSPGAGAGIVAVRLDPASTLDLESSLFSNSFGPNVTVSDGASATLAFNLFDTAAPSLPPGTVCAGSTAGGANLCGVAAPGLDPLAANGGPTLTMALQPTSPAIDMGSNPGGLNTDQRGPGFPRTQAAGTDIGAFEFGAACIPNVFQFSSPTYSVTEGTPTVTITVLRTAGDCPEVILYSSLDGSAVSPADYGFVSGTLTFLAGGLPSSLTFSVPIVDDLLIEPTEGLTVSLTDALNTFDTATVSILDNDAAAVLAIPTLGEWGLVLLALGLGVAGVRRAKAASRTSSARRS
jgi:CSLREA domain-containing protein